MTEEFARRLRFTDAQYEEASRRIDKFDNPNQLLIALLDVAEGDTCGSAKQQIAVGAATAGGVAADSSVTCNQAVASPTADGDQFRHTATATNCYESTLSSSTSSSSTSLCNSIATTTTTSSGLASASSLSSENQPLEGLAILHTNQQLHQNQRNQHNNLSRQKLQRSRSHQPTTSTNSNATTGADLRPVYIDGPNVARTHGKDLTFSWLGIKLCVDWFRRRNHRVKAFVPADKCDTRGSPSTASIINYLNQIDALIKTPLGCNDDMFLIEAANQSRGVIVSNDLYRDEKRSNSDLRNFISSNRLPYIFDDDHFIPASDPLGRSGPVLDEFLRFESTSVLISQQMMQRHSLQRTKSHQRQ